MKKTIAFLIAIITLCSFVGCDDKKNEDITNNTEIVEEETVPTAETNQTKETVTTKEANKTENPTEAKPLSGEYKTEDFKDINVKMSFQKTTPPIEVEEYDLSGIELEPKIPVCALPENRSPYIIDPNFEWNAEILETDIAEYEKELMKHYEPLLDKPVYPEISNVVSDGENIYYVAQYDRRCNYGISSTDMMAHDFRIYRYNIGTKENTCLYSYENSNEVFQIYEMEVVNDEILFSAVCFDHFDIEGKYTYGVFKLNSETNEPELSLEFEEEYFNVFLRDYDDSLFLSTLNLHTNEDIVYSYTNGEWKEFAKGDEYNDYFIYKGEIVRNYIKNHIGNEHLVTECSKFTLDTDFYNAQLMELTDSRATYLYELANTMTLYIYDFEKMERYIYTMPAEDGVKECIAVGKYLFIQTTEKSFYLDPEFGLAYEICQTESEPLDNINGKPKTVHCVSASNNMIAITEYTTRSLYPVIENIASDTGINTPMEADYTCKGYDNWNKLYILNR